MPPKSKITEIAVQGERTTIKRPRRNIDVAERRTEKVIRRTEMDELLDVDGLEEEDRKLIERFFRAASSNRVLEYLEDTFGLRKSKSYKEAIHNIRGLLEVEEDEEPFKKDRIISNLKIILEEIPNPDTKSGRGLTPKNVWKINELLTFNDVNDLKLEIGYLLRHKKYGIEVVMESIEDRYLTINQLPHLEEQHRLLHNQMLLAYNPMEGIELLKCKACGQKTYISGLVTNKSWDETQDVRGTCYNRSCRLSNQ